MEESSSGEQNLHHVGHIWTCGVVQSVLTVGLHNVSSMAFGKEHCLLLTSEGKLFAFGKNVYGQLGLGTQSNHLKEPQEVCSIQGKISKIACGLWNSGAVCSDGSVYMWGRNDSGQCGVTGDTILRPTLVKTKSYAISCKNCESPLQKKVKMVQISCGESHTLGLTAEHELWSWGSGSQLGLTTLLQSPPVPIEYLYGKKVISISCGSNYSLAVVQTIHDPKFMDCTSRYVQLCPKCKEEDVTVTETDDAIVIEQDHVCPLGLLLSNSNKSTDGSSLAIMTTEPVVKPQGVELTIEKDKPCDTLTDGASNGDSVFDLSYMERSEEQCSSFVNNNNSNNNNSNNSSREVNDSEIQVNSLSKIAEKELPFRQLSDAVNTIGSMSVTSSSETLRIQNEVMIKSPKLGNRTSFSLPPTVPENEATQLGHDTPMLSEADSTKATHSDENAVNKSDCSRERSKSEQESHFGHLLIKHSRCILKRTNSLIDPSTARDFYEKLVGSSPPPFSTDEIPAEVQASSALSDRLSPFVWSVMSKVKTSVEKLPLPSFGSATNSLVNQNELYSSSQESFEIVEPEFVERDEPDQESSLKRSESLKLLLEAKWSKRSKGFLRNNSFDGNFCNKVKDNKKNAQQTCKKEQHVDSTFQTEVWSWGAGDYFQLGHADDLERSQPCRIQQLSGQGVTAVLAGANHSVALTRDSRVYTWGRNDKGQLGHSLSVHAVSSPKMIQFPHRELVWDIAAGETHTIFLVDNRAPRVALYCCGIHDIVESCTCNQERGLRQLNILKKSGLMMRVFAGGPYGGCLVNQHGLSVMPILHEFSATERWFLFQLQTILVKLMTPILKDETLLGDMTSVLYEPLKTLIGQMTRMAEMVAVNTHDLTLAVLNQSHVDCVYMLEHQTEWLNSFLVYSQCLCDAISVGVPTSLTKSWSISPNILKMLARDTLCEVGLDQKSSSEIFQHLIEIPLRRAREYVRLLHAFSSSNQKRVSAVDLQKSSTLWQQLVDIVTWDIKIAEQTKHFWDNASHKMVDTLMTASRRLVRDSKKHPVHLQSSGRFSAPHHFALFNDILVHSHFSSMQTFPLQTVWVEPVPDTDHLKNAFILTMPEDTMTFTCSTSSQKTEWVCIINLAIRQSLGMDQDLNSRLRSNSGSRRLTPPLPRRASYVFTKGSRFKDAKYTGFWLCGKLQGQGEMVWPDGRKYSGKFKQNLEDGEGVLTVPDGDRVVIYDGIWKDGKMNGHGTIKYPNGDTYEGNFSQGQKHGHGMLKQGHLHSSAAYIYVGSWYYNQKNGYGVLDNICIGEKYLGMWENDCRHGPGIVVTIDGVFYQGSFVLDKLSGFGVMVFEDGTRYEGELGPEGALNGKGCLYLSNKDIIEGTFSGKWSDGIKLSGVYQKSITSDLEKGTSQESCYKPQSVTNSFKWNDVFKNCQDILGIQGLDTLQDKKKAWDAIAVSLAKRRRKKECKTKRRWRSFHKDGQDILERLPEIGSNNAVLTLSDYRQIQQYLSKACDCLDHPLGQLVDNIVDIYRASYLGVGAHLRLLPYACSEVQSFISRMYKIVRVLFTNLPPEGSLVAIHSELENQNSTESIAEPESYMDVEVVTPSALLHPILLPRLYPPLFTLYALYNEKDDELYWKRLLKWNRQSDIALMTFLGVNSKMWLMHIPEDHFSETGKRLSTIKEKYFAKAVDTLQHISTSFTPMEKLRTIHQAFVEINKEVQSNLSDDFIWTMDDLFPAFQYVVVRAQIQHLGAEIHFVDNLMERHFELGELGIMFTTLKACYFQIRTEKIQQY